MLRFQFKGIEHFLFVLWTNVEFAYQILDRVYRAFTTEYASKYCLESLTLLCHRFIWLDMFRPLLPEMPCRLARAMDIPSHRIVSRPVNSFRPGWPNRLNCSPSCHPTEGILR